MWGPPMKSVHAPRLWAEPAVARPSLSICKFILQTLLTVKSDLSHQNIFHIDRKKNNKKVDRVVDIGAGKFVKGRKRRE